MPHRREVRHQELLACGVRACWGRERIKVRCYPDVLMIRNPIQNPWALYHLNTPWDKSSDPVTPQLGQITRPRHRDGTNHPTPSQTGREESAGKLGRRGQAAMALSCLIVTAHDGPDSLVCLTPTLWDKSPDPVSLPSHPPVTNHPTPSANVKHFFLRGVRTFSLTSVSSFSFLMVSAFSLSMVRTFSLQR